MACIYTGALQRLYRAGDLWTSFLPGASSLSFVQLLAAWPTA